MKKYLIKTLKGITLPKMKDDNQIRQQRILNIILNAVILLMLFGVIIIIYNFLFINSSNNQNQSFSLFLNITILVIFIILRIFSYKGYNKLSAYLIISILFLLGTYTGYQWGVDSQAEILFYALVIIISGVLLGTQFSLASTIIISFSLFTINYLQNHQIIQANRSWIQKDWSNAEVATTSLILFIIATILWIFNRELKQLKIELKIAQNKEIAQIYHFAEFGKLSSALFHDLINPLTALMLNINKLKIDSENKPNFNHIKLEVNQALKASEKMKKYITSVRKQINFQGQKELFSLNQEIEEAIMILNYKARKKLVEIVFVAEANIKMHGDPIKFNQIVTNLLSNAIDSYNEAKNNKEIIINLSKIDHEIELKIVDHGQGIPDTITDQIFNPFFTTKNKGDNLGLGLSFIKQTIEIIFLGTISLNSVIGVGTVFTIKLPTK